MSQLFKWMWGKLTGNRLVSSLHVGMVDQKPLEDYDYARVTFRFEARALLEALGRRELEGIGHHWSRLVIRNEF